MIDREALEKIIPDYGEYSPEQYLDTLRYGSSAPKTTPKAEPVPAAASEGTAAASSPSAEPRRNIVTEALGEVYAEREAGGSFMPDSEDFMSQILAEALGGEDLSPAGAEPVDSEPAETPVPAKRPAIVRAGAPAERAEKKAARQAKKKAKQTTAKTANRTTGAPTDSTSAASAPAAGTASDGASFPSPAPVAEDPAEELFDFSLDFDIDVEESAAPASAGGKLAHPAFDEYDPLRAARPKPARGRREEGVVTVQLDLPEDGITPPARTSDGSAAGDEDAFAPAPMRAEDLFGAGKTSRKGAAPASGNTSDRPHRRPARPADEPAAPGRVSVLLLQLAAMHQARAAARRERRAAEEAAAEEARRNPPPEPTVKKAAALFARRVEGVQRRCRVILAPCLLLLWVSLGLPMAGALGTEVRAQTTVCLILLLAACAAAWDVLARGVNQLRALTPGPEALLLLSAASCALDALLLLGGIAGTHLPYAVIPAFGLYFMLLSEKQRCIALTLGMKTAASTAAPTVFATDPQAKNTIFRDARPLRGFVHRSTAPDFTRTVFTRCALGLIACAVVLSGWAMLAGEVRGHYMHTLSALLAVCCPFAAFVGFSFPFRFAAAGLRASGVAMAGWEGCRDFGRGRRVLVTDEDLFPSGTITLTSINTPRGDFIGKIVAYSAALTDELGGGLGIVFANLMARHGYAHVKADSFELMDGGCSGIVRGESVLFGTEGFLNLNGIRLPQNAGLKDTLYTAINGEVMGFFTMEYQPVGSVQRALLTLLQGRIDPVFAVRDFNITPQMLRQRFRLPTGSGTFPVARDRFDLSAPPADPAIPPAAVAAKKGLGTAAAAADGGRRLYRSVRINTVLGLLAAALGLVIVFMLCRTQSFDSVSAGNLLLYALIWLVPVPLLSLWFNR